MFFGIGKNKSNDKPSAPVSVPVSAPSVPSNAVSGKPMDPDDFFKGMGRKPKSPKDIAAPEVTGLRETAPPAPESTLPDLGVNFIETDGLTDKSAQDNSGYSADIDEIGGDIDIDAAFAAAAAPKVKEPEPEPEPPKMLDPEDFFKDMGRRPKKKEPEVNIESPDIIGLREAPEPVPESTLADIDIGGVDIGVLPDKTVPEAGVKYGDIAEI
ncbi:MAG: hypothetical protein NC120_13420 [Ruminococcus sp.]|nr:hypothetical protein [Ruminococcus sp.]